MRLAIVWLFALCATLSLPARADEAACRRFAEKTMAQGLSIMHAEGKTIAQKREELGALFNSSLNIDWLGQKVAGEYFTKANDSERAAYRKTYRTYLTDYYIGSLDENDMATILDIKITKFEAIDKYSYHAVANFVMEDDDPSDVDLNIVEENGKCSIHDFSVEGISMLGSQIEEIQSLGKLGGIGFITEKLAAHSTH